MGGKYRGNTTRIAATILLLLLLLLLLFLPLLYDAPL